MYIYQNTFNFSGEQLIQEKVRYMLKNNKITMPINVIQMNDGKQRLLHQLLFTECGQFIKT